MSTCVKGTLSSGHAMGQLTTHLGTFPRLSQAAKNSGSSQGLGGGPSSHNTTANKVETLKEEEEELKKKVEQCKVRSCGTSAWVKGVGVMSILQKGKLKGTEGT